MSVRKPSTNPSESPTERDVATVADLDATITRLTALFGEILTPKVAELDTILNGINANFAEVIQVQFDEIDAILVECTNEAHVQIGKQIRKLDSNILDAAYAINVFRPGTLPDGEIDTPLNSADTLSRPAPGEGTNTLSGMESAQWQSQNDPMPTRSNDGRTASPTSSPPFVNMASTKDSLPTPSRPVKSNLTVPLSLFTQTQETSQSSIASPPMMVDQSLTSAGMIPYTVPVSGMGVSTGRTIPAPIEPTPIQPLNPIDLPIDGVPVDGNGEDCCVSPVVVNVAAPTVTLTVEPCKTDAIELLIQNFISTVNNALTFNSSSVTNISNVSNTYDQRQYADNDQTYYTSEPTEDSPAEEPVEPIPNTPYFQVATPPPWTERVPTLNWNLPKGQNAEPGIRCKHILRFREACIELGDSIAGDQAGDKYDSNVLSSRLFAVVAAQYGTPKQDWAWENWQSFEKSLRHEQIVKSVQAIMLASKSFLANSDINAQRLHACKLWFEGIVSQTFEHETSLNWVVGDKYDNAFTADVIAGIVLPVIGGARGSNSRVRSFNQNEEAGRGTRYKIEMKIFSVACLDTIRWLCDQWSLPQIPSLNEVIASYLHGGMIAETYLCYLNLYGTSDDTYFPVLNSNRQRSNSNEIIYAHRRKLITDDQFAVQMRGNGWLHTSEVQLAYAMTEYLPGVSDLVRMMMRDVMDTSVVKEYDYDAEFADKFRGELVNWSHGQGVSDDVMKAYWRAHWDVPSNTQMYEMLHRLRSDKAEIAARGLAVTQDDVRRVLAINDMLPFWRERMIEISYHPLTRVDAQRMFMLGVIDRDKLVSAFRDLGYTLDGASGLADFTQRRRDDYLVRAFESRAFVKGALTSDQLRERLAKLRISEAEFEILSQRLETERKLKTSGKCVEAIRQSYMTGGTTIADVRAVLIQRGMGLLQAEVLIDDWQCVRAITEKQIPATTLCRWYSDGLITLEEMQLRLIRLGYRPADAANITRTCELTHVAAKAKIDKRNQDERQRDEEKAKAKLEKATEKLRKATEGTERQVIAEAKARARRKARLVKATEFLANGSDVTMDVAADWIEREIARLISEAYWSLEESEQLVVSVLKKSWDGDESEFELAMGNARRAAELLVPDDEPT